MKTEEEYPEYKQPKFSKRGLKKRGIRKPLSNRFSKTVKIKL